jgi:hypothetical protein
LFCWFFQLTQLIGGKVSPLCIVFFMIINCRHLSAKIQERKKMSPKIAGASGE